MSAPEADGYEFQSHGIIEVLEKLLDKFIDERTTTEKEETVVLYHDHWFVREWLH